MTNRGVKRNTLQGGLVGGNPITKVTTANKAEVDEPLEDKKKIGVNNAGVKATGDKIIDGASAGFNQSTGFSTAFAIIAVYLLLRRL